MIAVITILAALAFGIGTGVKNSQARAKAKGELVLIAQAIEQYKLKNGDYPWVTGDPSDVVDNGVELFYALAGWREFERSGGVTDFIEVENSDVPPAGPTPFLEVSKLNYVAEEGSSDAYPYEGGEYNPNLGDPASSPSDHILLDPWGNPYVFLYGQTSEGDYWELFGYHLYSLGPDGLDDTVGLNTTTGEMDNSFREAANNIDNIYVGE